MESCLDFRSNVRCVNENRSEEARAQRKSDKAALVTQTSNIGVLEIKCVGLGAIEYICGGLFARM